MNSDFLKNTIQNRYVFLPVIIVITLIVYLPSLQNEFTNWDDEIYVVGNELIKDLSFGSFKNYFTETVSSNYHPLTLFSLALDYNFFELNPFYYHLHNLFLHLLNVCLVFVFIFLLSKRNLWAAAFVSLVFAIHPMHVESVAWISERKDLLYTFYFLAGLVLYLKNIEKFEIGRYFLVVLLFVLSGFSKSAAVVFPLVLLLVDYYIKGKLQLKGILDKIPLLVISIIIGIVALKTQQGALSDFEQLTMGERLQFASFGFFAYVFKFFIPLNLNNLVLFPDPVPGYYYAFLIAFVIILFLGIKKYLKNSRSEFLFGFFFFLITIALILQIVSVGMAVIAERYTYVPYIGLAFGFFYLLKKMLNGLKNKGFIKLAYLLVFVFILAHGISAHERTKAWKNSRTLWNDAIKKDPNNHMAYLYLGYYYYNVEQYGQAIRCFDKTLQIKPGFKQALYRRHKCFVELKEYDSALKDIKTLRSLYNDGFYNDMGVVLVKEGKYSEALAEFEKAKSINEVNTPAIDLNLGICLLNTGKVEESLACFNSSLEKDSTSYEAYFSRAYAHYILKKSELAINDFSSSIQLNPKYKMSYWYRALVYSSENKFQESYDDYSEVIRIDPKNGDAFYSRSLAANSMQEISLALEDALKARELGAKVPERYLTSLQNRRH